MSSTHPWLEQGLQSCGALLTATPTIHVEDLRRRLIGLLEPVHHTVTHGLQLGRGLFAGEDESDHLGHLIGYAGEPLSRALALARQLLHHL